MSSNLYEILGIDPKATAEQVERAYRFSREMYGEAALATYSLLGPQELAEMRARVEVAYQVLKDPMRRQQYDSGSGSPSNLPIPFPIPRPEAVPVLAPEPAPAPAARAHGPEVLPEPVTGEALRRYREMRGIRLSDIALRSKVGVRFLEYIEGERFALLPAPVYLRSFLYEYAKAVGLDPKRTAESYMARLPRQA